MIKQTLTREWQELQLTQGTLRNTNITNRVEITYSSSVPNKDDEGILYGDYTFPIYALEGQKVYARSFDLDTLEVVLYKGFDLRVIGGIGGGTSGESPIAYKGSVDTYSDLLALTGVKSGDIYNVSSTGENYIYNGVTWGEYSAVIDISGKLDKGNLAEGIDAEDIYNIAVNNNRRNYLAFSDVYVDGIGKNTYLEYKFPSNVNSSLRVEIFSTWQRRNVQDSIILNFFISGTQGVKLNDVMGTHRGLSSYGYKTETDSEGNLILKIGMIGNNEYSKNVYIIHSGLQSLYSIPDKTLYSATPIDNTDEIFYSNIFKNSSSICGIDILGYIQNPEIKKIFGKGYIDVNNGFIYKYIGTTETILPSINITNTTTNYKQHTINSAIA